jgi:hypothetical protein
MFKIELPSQGFCSLYGLRVLGVIASLWVVLAIPFLTDTGYYFLTAFFFLGSGFLLTLIWLIIVIISRSNIRNWAEVAWCCLTPYALIVALLATTDLALAVRVAISENSLTQYISTVPAGTCAPVPKQFVGLFWVSETQECQGSVVLFTSACGFMNRSGLAYIPPGSRIPPGKWREVRRVYRNWYRFEWKF